MEEIASVFQLSPLWKSYICSLNAVTTLSAFNSFRTGQLVLFEMTHNTRFFELPFYGLLGVFGGVYGILVSRLNKRVAGFRQNYLADYAVREVVLSAVFSASFCYFNEFLKVDMTEAMQLLFAECSAKSADLCAPSSGKRKLVASLLFATVTRSFLTIITYGCKVQAGKFVPPKAAGATFGRALGMLVEHLNAKKYPSSPVSASCPTVGPCIISGTFELIGAGSEATNFPGNQYRAYRHTKGHVNTASLSVNRGDLHEKGRSTTKNHHASPSHWLSSRYSTTWYYSAQEQTHSH